MTETEYKLNLGNMQTQFKLGKAYYSGENIEQNCKRAWKLWLQLANQGHVEAQFELGRERYHNSKNLNHYIKAVKWLRQAANQKHIGAQFYLGEAYFYGKGVTLDYAKALEQYQKADDECDKQLNDEQDDKFEYDNYILDDIKNRLEYDSSNKIKQFSTTQEYLKAVKWSELANQGNIEAKYHLGVAFDNGEGVFENPLRAFELLHEAAEMGHSKAQVCLGILYHKGKIVSDGYSKAMYWWHQAAQQNNDDALFQIGLAYYKKNTKGQLVQSDLKQALYWWKKAADKGQREAQYRLGKHYYDNNEKLINAQAVDWWKKAAEQGHTDAQYYLGNAYYNGWNTEKSNQDQKQAIEWWQKAADQGHVTAQYNLGIVYKNNKLGVKEDYEKALQWLRKVAKHNNDPLVIYAQYHLGIMYKDGLGCSRNLQEAENWFNEIADKSGNVLTEKVVLDRNDIEKGLIETVRKLAHEALLDIEKILDREKNIKIEEQEKAKQELEDIMALFAHKFRGPLLNIQYNANHKNQNTRALKAVQTMTALLDIFSTISTDDIKLREKISQDKRGDRTLTGVLVESLLLAMPQLLIARHIKRIKQHYLSYAKKTGQIPSTATWEQLTDDYLDILENLQIEWENSFMELIFESSDLTDMTLWMQKRFFPIQIQGFNNNPICFRHYGATESVLIIVMTEMLLNSIKYYSATTIQPIVVRWKFQQDRCLLTCENPTTQKESDSSKGTHKGQSFLNMIARKLEGIFTTNLKQNRYTAEFNLPRHLLIEENK